MTAPPGWLADWQRGSLATSAALARFDSLSGVDTNSILGLWRGLGLGTGHPLDGLLEAHGWHGKSFVATDRVHPLLFRSRAGAVAPIDPAWLPVGVALTLPSFARSGLARAGFSAVWSLMVTRRPAARLENRMFRGETSAAMIYSHQPITDHFRRIDDTRLLGLMEMRSMARPFFFLLSREAESRTRAAATGPEIGV